MTIEQKEQENNYWLKERYTNLQLSRLGLLYYLYLTYAIKFDMKFQIDMLWQRTEENTMKIEYLKLSKPYPLFKFKRDGKDFVFSICRFYLRLIR